MFEEGIQGIRVLDIKIHDNVYFNCHVSTFKALKMENQVGEENYLLTISIFQHLYKYCMQPPQVRVHSYFQIGSL